MSNNILKIKYYGNGQFKGSEGASIFQSSNQQSTLQFKFDEDLGDASVVANILLPYPEGSQLYGQCQKQSLFMKKQVDAEGGYLYSGAILRGYLSAQGRAYVNAQVYAEDGYIDSINTGSGIVVNGIAYSIDYTTESIGGVSTNLIVLTDVNTGRVFMQQQEGIIVLEHDLICLIKQFEASRDGDNLFNGTLRLTSGVAVKNYQQVEFKITASAPYYSPYPLTIEESYILRQQLAIAQSDIVDLQTLKQNIALDPATITAIEGIITTGTAPTDVEPSLIDLFTRTQANLVKNNNQDTRMDGMQDQIDAIAQAQVVGIRVIGTITTNTLPTSAELDQFRLDRGFTDATNGDIVYINLQVSGGTDEFYIATYSVEDAEWTESKAQFLENASNTDKGIVEGTADEQTDTTKILFDIQNGKIVDALAYKNNAWVSIRTYLTDLDNILNGTTPVPKATGDAQGNNIQTTYQTKVDGASKEYVQEYAMPRAVNDVYYMDFTNETLEPEIVDNNDLTCNITATGDNALQDFELTLPQDIEIGAKNGMLSSAFIQPAVQMTGSIHAIIKYAKADELFATWYTLGADYSETKQMMANTKYKFEVNVFFDQLQDMTTLEKGDKIKLELYFYTENLYTSTMDLIANETDKGIAFIDRLSYVQYVVATNDYDQLDNKPIINENLSNVSVGDLATNTLYRHIGATDSTYTMGMIYFKQTAQDVAMTPLWKEWVEGASLGGTALSVVNNIIEIPAITPDLVPFVDLADMVDNTPTASSDNLITSGGVYSALQSRAENVVVDTASTSPITLANNTSFRLGTISALTINAPSSYDLDFECEVIFTADSTISMTYSAVSPTWSGDDVSGGVFTPVASKTYNILFFNNATAVATPSIQAIVRGV